MSQPADTVDSLTHDQLPRLHHLTAEVQKICRGQLRKYLDALAPLFRPRRVLGEHMEGAGQESVTGADQTFAELREIYFKACGRPFDLRKELPTPLESVGTQIGLYEWEYEHDARTERASRTITGVDLAYEDLDTDKPEGFESGPTEDAKDDNVEMDPDERLPWPDANLIAKWWEKHTNEFQPRVRHLLGKPITADWMQQVLRIGRQRQRAAAALELAIMQPGQPLFEVRAPGFRQQELLRLTTVG
jgi:hypothetical protein